MDRRLFVGFPVVVDSSLESALKRTKINSQKREMEVDWVAQANHHVTLYFLGAIEESRLLKTAEIVARVASETLPGRSSHASLVGRREEKSCAFGIARAPRRRFQ